MLLQLNGYNKPLLRVSYGFDSRQEYQKKSIGLIQIVSDLFSLRIGTFILFASKLQSLLEVSNDIFIRLFFFLDIATERKPYQRNDKKHRKEKKETSCRYLFVDYKMSGVGTQACGPVLNKKYKICEKNINFDLEIFKVK